MFVLETNGLAAIVAKIWSNCVKGSAVVAEDLSRIERVDLDLGAAVLTVCAKVLEALEITALALPVSDLVLDILERRCLSEIGDGENRSKY